MSFLRPRTRCRTWLTALAVSLAAGCTKKGPCPQGTELIGSPPPEGFEQWCQRRDQTDTFVKNGPYKRWHKNGKLAESGRYVDNLPTGFWEAWHASGSKAMEGNYKQGIREGRWLKWKANGEKSGDTTFKDGVAMTEVLFDDDDQGRLDATTKSLKANKKDKHGGLDPADPDRDWVPTARDNCPQDANPKQIDLDQDGQGDACDDDDDGDKRVDLRDNCPKIPNANQEDLDRDGKGDHCDTDRDGDGVENEKDNCKDHKNPDQADSNNNGEGDVCEALKDRFDRDSDGDGIPDQPAHLKTPEFCVPGALTNCFDNCLLVPNPDQNPMACTTKTADADGDGVPNYIDNCLLVANPGQEMTFEQPIAEGGDACFRDFDADGVYDSKDNCPFLANKDQKDSDKDGLGDACTLKKNKAKPPAASPPPIKQKQKTSAAGSAQP